MYRAILVDDEPLFLQFLQTQVDWARYGLRIDRTFVSSSLALEHLNAGAQADVLLTDIKMPGLTGIQLIEGLSPLVRERAYIVVLSGYDDFPLVRQAFLAGASDYMLKADIGSDDFERAMGKMLEYLDARAQRPDAAATAPEDSLVDEIKRYIGEHLGGSLSLSQLAGSFGFSPGYLSQLFSRLSGSTLTDCIIRARMDRAKQLLRDTSKPVTEIAYEVGFNSPEHFTRTFRRMEDKSPREWRGQGGEGAFGHGAEDGG